MFIKYNKTVLLEELMSYYPDILAAFVCIININEKRKLFILSSDYEVFLIKGTVPRGLQHTIFK